MGWSKEIPKLYEFEYKFIVSDYNESTGIETRNLCVKCGENQNAILYTYEEPRHTNKAILNRGVYTIMNPLTLLLLPVGLKGFENIIINKAREFNFIGDKDNYLLTNFLSQATQRQNKGEINYD